MVAPGVAYGMGRVAQAMTEDQGIELELLFDLPEARQWPLAGNSPKDNAKASQGVEQLRGLIELTCVAVVNDGMAGFTGQRSQFAIMVRDWVFIAKAI